MTITQGLSKEQYAEIKKAAKAKLSFRVSMRYHKQRYCYGSIDLRPYNKPHWTPEETREALAFVISHNLHIRTNDVLYENIPYVFHQGFGYLMQIVEG